MDLGLENSTAYVTGGATGIGRSVVETLVREGARVFVADLNEDAVREYAADLPGVSWGRFDLASREGVEAAADAALAAFDGPPDILINNVGAGRMLAFEEITDEQWHATFELNFFSMVRTSRRIVPLMRERGHGAVVSTASDLALQAEPLIVDYAASKNAILTVSKALARAYAPQVRVNAVCPGPIWTPFWSAPGGFAEKIEQQYGVTGQAAVDAFVEDRGIPLGRMGRPEEVAAAIAYLASPAAAFTTGSIISIDGGTVRATA